MGVVLGIITRLTGSGLLWKVALISYSVNLSFQLKPGHDVTYTPQFPHPPVASAKVVPAAGAGVRREC